jgi:enoyl-CoA hydratase/carnithine racemase
VVDGVNRLITAWYGFPRPVVTAVNGHAVAGGLIFALCGDLRYGVSIAKLGLTEVSVGIPYPVAAIAVAKAEVPRKMVRRLVLGGELIAPGEAHAAGLLDEIVDDDALIGGSLEAARRLAAHPRSAYATVKRQLRGDVLDEIAARAEHDPLADS